MPGHQRSLIRDLYVRQYIYSISLRKHAYSNILKILLPKNDFFFKIKNSDIFHNPAQNIDCGYSLEQPRRGGSNEYPQSMLFSNIRKIMFTPVNDISLYKSGFLGDKICMQCHDFDFLEKMKEKKPLQFVSC